MEVAGAADIPDEVNPAQPYQTRSGRTIKRPKLQSIEEGHQFATVNGNIEDGIESKYTHATNAISAAETKSMNDFLCAQSTYIASLHTYTEVNNSIEHAINHIILTQVGMKKGIKLWGEQGVDAIITEMKQFHDREVVRPLLPKEITYEVRKRALGYLMFLKKKRNGKIKGRGCADGRP